MGNFTAKSRHKDIQRDTKKTDWNGLGRIPGEDNRVKQTILFTDVLRSSSVEAGEQTSHYQQHMVCVTHMKITIVCHSFLS